MQTAQVQCGPSTCHPRGPAARRSDSGPESTPLAGLSTRAALGAKPTHARTRGDADGGVVQDAIEKETTLNILMHQSHRRGDAVDPERVDAIAVQRGLPAAIVPQYLSDLYTLAVTDTNPHQPFTIRLMQLCDRVRSSQLAAAPTEAWGAPAAA